VIGARAARNQREAIVLYFECCMKWNTCSARRLLIDLDTEKLEVTNL